MALCFFLFDQPVALDAQATRATLHGTCYFLLHLLGMDSAFRSVT